MAKRRSPKQIAVDACMRALDVLEPDVRREAFDTVKYIVERDNRPARPKKERGKKGAEPEVRSATPAV